MTKIKLNHDVLTSTTNLQGLESEVIQNKFNQLRALADYQRFEFITPIVVEPQGTNGTMFSEQYDCFFFPGEYEIFIPSTPPFTQPAVGLNYCSLSHPSL